jgi:uncharacterized membrane protein YgcG
MKIPENSMSPRTFPRFASKKVSDWRKSLVAIVTLCVFLVASAPGLAAFQDQQNAPPPDQNGQGQGEASAPPAYTAQSPEQLQQLVAPIALYPDSLVAQILAGSTFPAQVVEADRWLQDHPDLKGDALAQAVNQQDWDPSIKALTGFPTVLANMDKNLSWTSSLGDAYYNQQQDVMDAIQVMRQKAENSGNLKSTPQQTVVQQGPSIVIQPAQPDVVYVPAYDPWLVYGYPITPWPYWYPVPGIWFGGPYLSFGIGFGIGWYGGYGWGWHNWGTNWGNHVIVYNHNTYYSHSNTFYNRNNYYRNGGYRGVTNNVNRGVNGENRGNANHGEGTQRGNVSGRTENAGDRGRTSGNETRGDVFNRNGATPKPFNGNANQARGYGFDQNRDTSGMHSDAFSGYDHGGETRSYSDRGRSSFGGGGFGGGGGGFHGGGGGGGGRHR